MEQYYSLSHRFSQVLKKDPYSGGDGYMIRSLYFDTIDDGDYMDKVDGVEVRRKIRLRYYGSGTPSVMLEIKQKQGMSQRKRSLKMRKEDAAYMAEGDYSVLLSYDDPFAVECFVLMNTLCYRPKAVISYIRRVYIADENRTRITFDRNITGTESSFNFLNDNLPEYSLLDPCLAVLEVKFGGFLLSYIKDILNTIDSSEISASKYCFGRTVSKHYFF